MKVTSTGHVIGATYRSRYWGGTYKVIGPAGEFGVEVECVEPGAGAHQTPGERFAMVSRGSWVWCVHLAGFTNQINPHVH